MNAAYAEAIAAWHYEGVYSFYDFEQDPEDKAELLDSAGWKGRYFAVLDEAEEIIGFFCFDLRGDTVEVGLGLRPERTGKGLGRVFVQAGLAFARERFHPQAFRIQVAEFNQRAIRVYERLGFRKEKKFLQQTNGGEYEFVSMVREENEEE